MIVYEFVADADDTWYSLGLFESAGDILTIVTNRDGPAGQSVLEGGESGETLFIRRRVVGDFNDSGSVVSDVARITRERNYSESTDESGIWTSTIVWL